MRAEDLTLKTTVAYQVLEKNLENKTFEFPHCFFYLLFLYKSVTLFYISSMGIWYAPHHVKIINIDFAVRVKIHARNEHCNIVTSRDVFERDIVVGICHSSFGDVDTFATCACL